MRPLKDCRQLVSPSEFDTIFMGIEVSSWVTSWHFIIPKFSSY